MSKSETLHADHGIRLLWPYGFLLIGSFVPFLMKAVEFLRIQSYVPFVVFVVLLLFVCLSLRKHADVGLRAVRRWAYALLAWSILRAGIMVLLYFFNIGQAHPLNQLNAAFILITLLHVVLAVVLLRKQTDVVQSFAFLRH